MRINPFDKYLKDEDNLQIATTRLMQWRYPEFRYHHSPNEGKRTAFERYLVGLLGVKPGFMDLIIFYNGCILSLELKSISRDPKKPHEPTDYQMDWLNFMREEGHFSAWSDNLEEIESIFKAFKSWADGKGSKRVQTPEIRKRREKKTRAGSTSNKIRRGIK